MAVGVKYYTYATLMKICFLLRFRSSLANIPDHFFPHPNTSNITDQLSWNLKLLLLKDYFGKLEETRYNFGLNGVRTKGSGSRVDGRRQRDPRYEDETDDENSMKLKLFRLMYETVRDSDLKAKRAELIRTHYANSSVFEIGYLMGDVNDKYNIMNDVWKSTQRLFNEWTPMEHIIAYEQISNQAIEVGHLVDLIKAVSKREEASVPAGGRTG